MAEDFDTEAWTLMSIALAFILLRIYSRCSFEGVKNLALDDYLMVAAGLVYVAETVEAYLVGQEDGLTNGAMTDAARAALDPSSSEYAMRVAGSKVQLSGWLTMIVSNIFSKQVYSIPVDLGCCIIPPLFPTIF